MKDVSPSRSCSIRSQRQNSHHSLRILSSRQHNFKKQHSGSSSNRSSQQLQIDQRTPVARHTVTPDLINYSSRLNRDLVDPKTKVSSHSATAVKPTESEYDDGPPQRKWADLKPISSSRRWQFIRSGPQISSQGLRKSKPLFKVLVGSEETE